ncbi:MAG TPA: ROK family transcriptional regulator [Solirubrobacteraceae bacterium]|jgi:predicted NBD/HSP70 family sugar kinase|nr:ROK family transcriptional regulator [Solirubrobacteraceae bacterium]
MYYTMPADWYPRDMRDPAAPAQLTNERRLLDVLLRSKAPTTQSDIVRKTGMSRSTVATLVERLNQAHLLEQDQDLLAKHVQANAAPHSSVGRPPVWLALAPESGVAVGVDFGHRHLRVAVASADGEVQAERELRNNDANELLDVLRDPLQSLSMATQLVKELTAEVLNVSDPALIDPSKVVGMAVGLPGPVDLMRGVLVPSRATPGWRGIKPADELRKRLGWEIPALIENDATLAAVCEHERGVLRGVADCIYVKWATGIGGAIILDGAIRRGTRGLAGELGHMPVPGDQPTGPVCEHCGKHCLQSAAGGKAIVAQVEATSKRTIHELVRDMNGAPGAEFKSQLGNPLRDVIELAKRDDAHARAALQTAAESVGATLASLVTLLNPRTIVIGGSFESDAYGLITDGLRTGLNMYGLPAALDDLELKTGTYTGCAAVRGAIALVLGRELASFLGRQITARTPSVTATPQARGARRKTTAAR